MDALNGNMNEMQETLNSTNEKQLDRDNALGVIRTILKDETKTIVIALKKSEIWGWREI